jgi:hypothetical protein
MKQAKAQLESIMAMVAALKCDYDRLEELRDEKAELVGAREEARKALEGQEHDEDCANFADCDCHMAELTGELGDASDALAEWEAENGEELAELEEAAGDCEGEEQARERIDEDPLSVELRSGWCNSKEEMEPEEFKILLCTGGPAVQIIGDLGQWNEPERASLQHQDWFERWEDLHLTSEEEEIVLEYCRCFYFGE